MEWQPIKSAPEEGYFLVYEGGAMRCRMRENGQWVSTAVPAIRNEYGDLLVGYDARRILGGDTLVDADNCCLEPTHWMPLPPPPTQESSP